MSAKSMNRSDNKRGKPAFGAGFAAQLLCFAVIFSLLVNGYVIKTLLFSSRQAYMPAARSGKEAGTDSGGKKVADSEKKALEAERKKTAASEASAALPAEKGRIRAAGISLQASGEYNIDSQSAAEQLIRDAGDRLGVDTGRYEYKCTSSRHHYLTDIYILNQYYRGVPVLGHVLTMAVNPDGSLRTLIGNEAQIPDKTDELFESAISKEDAKKVFTEYLNKKYKDTDDLNLYSLGPYLICEDEDTRPVYIFRADRKDRAESTAFHVDGQTGKVESYGNLSEAGMQHKTLEGQTGEKTLSVNVISDREILLQDTGRHIAVCSFGEPEEIISVNPQSGSDRNDKNKQSATDALYNIQRAWQYFDRTHAQKGLGEGKEDFRIYVGLPAGMMDDNAVMVRNPSGMQYILVGAAKKADLQMSAYIDLMGHEYTHGLINEAWQKEFGINYPKENDVLSEGLADIFGELIEDSYDGKGKDSRYDNTCDWEMMKMTSSPRSAKEPLDDQITAYDDKDQLQDIHDGTYLISHPAWLMTQGAYGGQDRAVNNVRLSQLYYNAFLALNGFSDLRDFRFALENMAAFLYGSKRINGDQVGCIEEALDRTGIPGCHDYYVRPETEICVYDRDNDYLQKSRISIYSQADPKNPLIDKAEFDGIYNMKADPGFYRAEIYDCGNHLLRSFSFAANGYAAKDESAAKGDSAAKDGRAGRASGAQQYESRLNLFTEIRTGPLTCVKITGPAELSLLENGKEVLSDKESSGYGIVSTKPAAGAKAAKGQEKQGETGKKQTVIEYYPLENPEICLTGKGEGKVNLDILHQDEKGQYAGRRSFRNLQISGKTKAFIVPDFDKETLLTEDRNGDGRADRIFKAGEGRKAVPARIETVQAARNIFFLLLAIFLLFNIIRGLVRSSLRKKRERKEGPVCEHCGMVNRKGARACRRCGKLLPAPDQGHESKFSRGKEKKSRVRPAFIAAVIFLLISFFGIRLSINPGPVCYREYVQNHPGAGNYLYEQGVKKSGFQRKLFHFLMNRFESSLARDKNADQEKINLLKDNLKGLDR